MLKSYFREFSQHGITLDKNATVIANRAYFYKKPDDGSKTTNYIVSGQDVSYTRDDGDFIYALFAYKGDNFEGWMLKSDFREFSKTAVAIADKAFFYYDPDISTKRTAYIITGQEVRYFKEEGNFIFATFTYKGVKTEGWMNKAQFENR